MAGIVLGVVAAIAAGGGAPAAALRSNLVFRIEVGAIAAVAAYCAAAALWLAWHRTLFQRMGVGGAGLESPEQREAIKERDVKIEEFMARTTETLDDLVPRLEHLEGTDSENDNRGTS